MPFFLYLILSGFDGYNEQSFGLESFNNAINMVKYYIYKDKKLRVIYKIY